MSRRNGDIRLVLGPPPRANLLPEEVRADRRARAVRRSLRLVLVVAVLVAVSGVGFGRLVVQQSAMQLQLTRDRTQSLFMQQTKYGDISSARARLTSTATAMRMTSAAGIRWKAYLDRVSDTLPTGVIITSVAVDAAAPGTVYPAPTAPLQGTRVATLTFQVATSQLGAIPSWLDALAVLPGFVDAEVGSVTTDTGGAMRANVVLHVGAKAFTVTGDAPVQATADPAAVPSGSPAPTSAAPTTPAPGASAAPSSSTRSSLAPASAPASAASSAGPSGASSSPVLAEGTAG